MRIKPGGCTGGDRAHGSVKADSWNADTELSIRIDIDAIASVNLNVGADNPGRSTP
jgi:hypothetical protein